MTWRHLIIGLLCLGLLPVAVLAADADIDLAAKGLIGPFCFSLDNYADTWHWRVDNMGGGAIQVTGYDYVFAGSAMTGGGQLVGNMLYLDVYITVASTGWRAVHTIELDINTYTGTTDFTWYDETGNPTGLVYLDEPFSRAGCTKSERPGLQPSAPLPADIAAPGPDVTLGDKVLTGMHCFKLDTYSDTWHMWFEDMGGGIQQITGYNEVYGGSALTGGGVQMGDHLYLAMIEVFQPGGQRAIHAMDINLATNTGVSTFIWKSFDEIPFAPYFMLGLSGVGCAAKVDDSLPTSYPGPVGKVPDPGEYDPSIDVEAVIGTYCIDLLGYADSWQWTVDKVGPDGFQVTGYDPNFLVATHGGGWRFGNMLYLVVGGGYAISGQRSLNAIEFDLGLGTGTTDLTWINVDGTGPLPYPDFPIARIPCVKQGGERPGMAGGLPLPVDKGRDGPRLQVGTELSNAPDPFNPKTEISFRLDAPASITLQVYDVAGRLVRNLLSETRDAGLHKVVWDGCDNSGSFVASGVYFCALNDGTRVTSERMLLMK